MLEIMFRFNIKSNIKMYTIQKKKICSPVLYSKKYGTKLVFIVKKRVFYDCHCQQSLNQINDYSVTFCIKARINKNNSHPVISH